MYQFLEMFSQVDILISKNQALQILHHVASYDHHLLCSDTVATGR